MSPVWDADAVFDAVGERDARVPIRHAGLISLAQRSAATVLANSAKRPSPVVLTMRP
jgi:hypothetical protein